MVQGLAGRDEHWAQRPRLEGEEHGRPEDLPVTANPQCALSTVINPHPDYRQRALDNTCDASFEFEALLEGIFGTTGIVAPMALAHLRGGIDIEIYNTLESLRL